MTHARLIDLSRTAPIAALRAFAGAAAEGQVTAYLNHVQALRAEGLDLADHPEAAHDLSTPHLWLARLISLQVEAHEAGAQVWTAWRRERWVFAFGGFALGFFLSRLF